MRLRGASPVALVALVALAGCAASEPPDPFEGPARPGPPLAIDDDSGRELLEFLASPGSPRPAAVERLVPWLAFAADVPVATVEAELAAAQRGAGRDPAAKDVLTFREARAFATESAQAVVEAARALRARKDVIVAAVARLVPDDGVRSPPFTVSLVAGLPAARAVRVVADGDARVLLVDARALERRVLGPLADDSAPSPHGYRDALGEELERIVAPELFHAAFEAYVAAADEWRDYAMQDGLAFALFMAIDDGTAAALAYPRELALDDMGRRTPQVDVTVRAELAEFEAKLERVVDPATPAAERKDLEWQCWNGAKWGTRAAARMLEAVDRLGPPGRLRQVLANGPIDLVDAYVQASGHAASVPPLGERAREILRALRSRTRIESREPRTSGSDA